MTMPASPGYASPPPHKPARVKLYGLPLIITGVILAAACGLVLVTGDQEYNACNSGLGDLAQAVNATARTNCQQTDTGHNVCVGLMVIGLGLVAWGVIRMFWKRQQAAAPQPPQGWQQ